MKTPKTLFLVVFMLLAASLFGQTADDLLGKIKKAADESDWATVEQIARRGVEKYPAENDYYGWLAYALCRRKRFAEALALVEPFYQKRDRDEQAQSIYVTTLVDTAWDCLQRDDADAALPYLAKAYQILPHDPWVLNGYGVALVIKGKLDEGIAALEEGYASSEGATALKNDLLWAYLRKARVVREGLKDRPPADGAAWDSVEDCYKKALDVDGTSTDVLYQYGGFLIDAARYDEAVVILEKGEKAVPPGSTIRQYFTDGVHQALLAQAHEMVKNKQWEAAIFAIHLAQRKYPKDLWLWLNLTKAYVGKKDFTAAAEALVDVASLDELDGFGGGGPAERRDQVQHATLSILWDMCEAGEFKTGFDLVDRLERSAFPKETFLVENSYLTEGRGLLTFFGVDRKKGIALVNRAYAEYLKAHPGAAAVVTVDFPLKGNYRVGGNNRSDDITHAGLDRFCFDFTGANDKGDVLKPGVKEADAANDDYYGFGADVFSPVDGTVEDVVDAYDDITPRAAPDMGNSNNISIVDDQGFHYMIAHLKKGSVAVKTGQKVQRGDKLAQIGNNGYSSRPHLHFGVYTPDFRASVPVRFAAYSLVKNGKAAKVKDGTPQHGDLIRN
jgi:tetratricopeptide (TPR) repeat protein